jgi:molybdopterin-guanine dinucleotide biosynthesis protein A
MTPKRTTLSVLAGGEGSRMGRPKGLLTVGDKPMLQYVLERMDWAGPTLLVTAPGREGPPGSELFDREVVDPVAGLGPLRGILTALEAAETERVAILTVDMPCVLFSQVKMLAGVVGADPHVTGAMFRREPEDGSAVKPFPAVFRRSAARLIRKRIKAGRRSVQALGREKDFLLIPPLPAWGEGVWTNLNEPEDYEAFVRTLE